MPAPQYLLDTNILIHLIRGDDLGQFADVKYELRNERYRPLISIVTRGEVKSFAHRLKWGDAKVKTVIELLDNLITYDITPPVVDAYAEIDSASISLGKRMGKNDIWIAATAKVTSCVLITTDPDFDHLHPDAIQRIHIDPEAYKTKRIRD